MFIMLVSLVLLSTCSSFCLGFVNLQSRRGGVAHLITQSNSLRRSFPSSLNMVARSSSMTPSLVSNSTEAVATAWECDEEANCVQVPACDEEACRTSLDVRIHNKWYDLSGWRKAHPAGDHWIDWYDGRDATEVMDAFHTKKALEMYKRLPESKPESINMLKDIVPDDSPTQIAFRKLRAELEEEGWFERDLLNEAKLLGIWTSLVVSAALTAHSIPVLSTVLFGLSMTNTGQLGHDYVNCVDDFSKKMQNFAAMAAGLDPVWWSERQDKHNKDHALTNQMGVDEDIATDPFLQLWPPAPENG